MGTALSRDVHHLVSSPLDFIREKLLSVSKLNNGLVKDPNDKSAECELKIMHLIESVKTSQESIQCE